nr:MAG TPA: hypothetical protein [Caudoviricetes sp.]
MFFVIGIDADGFKFTERAKTIDEAKFIKDRLGDVGITDVYITKPVNIKEEERKYYENIKKDIDTEFQKKLEEVAGVLQNWRFA